MISEIKKRDGKIVPFSQDKITDAIFAAGKAEAESKGENPNREIAERISAGAFGALEQKFYDLIPTVEQVQDVVERTLMKMGYPDTAKRYIIYRQKHKEKREMDSSKREVFNFARRLFSGYTEGSDWRTKENSNSGQITFQGANARFAGDLWNLLALHDMYSKENPEIADAHESGQLHIHDLDFPVIAYCCGHSLEQLFKKGVSQVRERVQSSPAKHLRSAVSHIVNYIGIMQGEFAGAQAFSSVDTFLAAFVKTDRRVYGDLIEREVDQGMQELVFGLNIPSRWGWQAPFSNLTFDLVVPEDLAKRKAIVGGEEQDFTYGECQEEMNMINISYIKEKLKGDKDGRIFTFPIDTYNLTRDFGWDSEIADLLFELTGKYGVPYFQNFINSGLDPKDIRAMCCRLQLDQTKLMKRPGSMWGIGDSTGSIGVVTINMNRLGFEARGEDEFLNLLGHRMDLAMQSLEIKRKVSTDLLERGFVPYTKSYLGHFMNHFSTIGLVGMHEGLINFIGKGIETEEGIEFGERVLKFMNHRLEGYQEETGNLYNLEATPAEGTSHRLAKLDRQIYPHIYTSGDGAPYLTNSTQLPVDLDIDLWGALQHQDRLQTLYTGGTLFNVLLGERISGGQAKNLTRKIAENVKLPYFSITPVFSVCDEHGYIAGNHPNCPTCGKEDEVYDRVVGYIRPVRTWNDGKQEEFRQRKRFQV
jgi:ribonucleoside-triphosphate reductase